MNFADNLFKSIETSGSVLCAGFDPQPEMMPKFLLDAAAQKTSSDGDYLYSILRDFYGTAIEALAGKIAIIKPNIAFFEQFGLSGLRAFSEIITAAKKANMLVIADAKRGDIGSTAEAYANAFLGSKSVLGRKVASMEVDAVTVSPFLGFDTLQPFIDRCTEDGKGIFVLVKTSNPGSKDLQDIRGQDGVTISQRVANFLAEQSAATSGSSGYSSVGAVVGATHPDEARALRTRMPKNYFLIPGYGAQGGSAEDAVAGFSNKGGGAVVNVSRALFSKFGENVQDHSTLVTEVRSRATKLNGDLLVALAKRSIA